MGRKLIYDLSPCLYGSLFSATTEVKRNGAKPVQKPEYECPKFHFDYGDIVTFKILDELTKLKRNFNVDEVIIAVDNSSGGYWRKDYWAGYKYGRKKGRDDSEIEWDKAFPVFEDIKKLLKDHSSYKVLDVPRAEADDIGFVLSEYLSDEGHEIILYTVDHDWIYNLKHPGVQYWKDNRTSKRDSHYVEAEPGELIELELDHLIGGDPGDYIKNVKAYSVFSPLFKEIYPHMTELKAWPMRHEIDIAFEEKYGESAYKHPRYGYKMFLRSKLTVTELLAQNPIYKLNYDLNKIIAMPEGIPQEIRKNIIEEYHNAPSEKNAKELNTFFIENNLFELTEFIAFI